MVSTDVFYLIWRGEVDRVVISGRHRARATRQHREPQAHLLF
jgi:hypothetical protein